MTREPAPAAAPARGSVGEVFLAFLRLGLTSFGGPTAHLGYFRDELVTRRRWLDDSRYGELVALAQFLPGPASSQVGFALGLLRAGPLGAVVAWLAFTLPSAMLLVGFAYAAAALDSPVGDGIVTGLKIVAVAIVAQAVWGMARTLAPDARRGSIAVVAVVVALLAAGSLGQVAAIALGALAGLLLCREPDAGDLGGAAVGGGGDALVVAVSRRAGAIALGTFAALLMILPMVAAAAGTRLADIADGFYRAGALVFGGGHVMLPLLQAEVVAAGWVSPEQFLAGYGAAQAVPGPLFTFAAYLGALSAPGAAGLLGAAVALVAVFLPGMLVMVGVLPFWSAVRTRPAARALLRGANAAVLGILAAALYDPVFVTAVVDAPSFALAAVCFVLLVAWRMPPWAVVLVGAVGGLLITLV
ncbi:chromate efflux transporter [Microbacterium sp. zg.Y1090]|uniref:chromate efflux transporter n=1 Tax=Microbacterium wangruii TaxID=3049073 RepID=UPI00214C2420|nr:MULTISPECIES: chromate efflux transporter [unclassified Microbacterium]MCR2817739.1 chromate efflux transporter [Microbacterium sp. zg.Y1090]WIM28789.1 chromate efflux transporter [Microbacterium sp. zg-Y1090]